MPKLRSNSSPMILKLWNLIRILYNFLINYVKCYPNFRISPEVCLFCQPLKCKINNTLNDSTFFYSCFTILITFYLLFFALVFTRYSFPLPILYFQHYDVNNNMAKYGLSTCMKIWVLTEFKCLQSV